MSHTEYLCQKLIYDILWSIYFCKNKVIRITMIITKTCYCLKNMIFTLYFQKKYICIFLQGSFVLLEFPLHSLKIYFLQISFILQKFPFKRKFPSK